MTCGSCGGVLDTVEGTTACFNLECNRYAVDSAAYSGPFGGITTYRADDAAAVSEMKARVFGYSSPHQPLQEPASPVAPEVESAPPPPAPKLTGEAAWKARLAGIVHYLYQKGSDEPEFVAALSQLLTEKDAEAAPH